MSDVDHLMAWCADIAHYERCRGARLGRCVVDRQWLVSAHMRARLAMASAANFSGLALRQWEEMNLALLTSLDSCMLFGVPVYVVESCEPPLCYIPFRNPLIFGASA